MKTFLSFLTLLLSLVNFAQVIDDFSDGDFTSNPTWSGTTSDFIVNTSNQVQLNAVAAGSSYLSTPHGLSTLDNQEWSVWLKIATAPSGGNFGVFYLTATNPDLSTNPDGFYLQLGEAGSLDEVRLMKRSGGVSTELCASSGTLIASAFEVGVKVIRDNTGTWSLFVDPTGGSSYTFQNSTIDGENIIGTHLGYTTTYTLSNITKYYFDDVYAGPEIVDVTPPVLLDVIPVDATHIDLIFDEPLNPTPVSTISNYDIQPFLSATAAVLDGIDPKIIHLTLSAAMVNGETYNAFAFNMEDLNGNVNSSQNLNYIYLVAETPSVGDVIINEFFCDPSPSVGLPEVEFVEVYNRSSKVFNLNGWEISDGSSTGTLSSDYWLSPGEYRIICASASLVDYPSGMGATSFPSLNNTGDNIVLLDNTGGVIDELTYTLDWYHDPLKEDGGFTIERINPDAICSDENNWRASNASNGGTPNAINSVYDNTPDTELPTLITLIAIAPNQLEIYFSEGMDSTSLADAIISISPSLTESNRIVGSGYPNMLILEFIESFISSQAYTITLQNVSDCSLNTTNLSGVFALPAIADKGDLVINEILFNPLTGGSDWIELYNNSNKLIDLQGFSIANFDDDTISNHKVISDHYLLYPETFVVIGADSQFVINNYASTVLGHFVQQSLPTMTNDSSTIYVINADDVIIDVVSYSSDWHFKLLDDDDGKSLERIDYDVPSNEQGNWHTAAEDVGFATPGGQNSQYNPAIINGELSFTSETVSPDNDGFEDFLQINYELSENGLVGTVSIFDDNGRKIVTVIEQELLGISGTLVWDGITSQGTKASIGVYVLLFETFSIDGEVNFTNKKAFVVAGKL